MDKLTDFYKIVPKSMKTEYHNPNFKKHLLTIPFRMLIVGASGSGKSTLVLEILKRAQDTFGNVTLICKNADEPLYKFLRSKIKEDQLQIFEGIDKVPDLESLDKELQHLVIFDDLVLDKDQSKIEQYFIRGRKIAKGVSMVYLTQSYF
ncbi:ATP-binding cassette domain-containing protein, partial [bacterium]|nr:ATP-binding cassette domain-containing protein [bacterium]